MATTSKVYETAVDILLLNSAQDIHVMHMEKSKNSDQHAVTKYDLKAPLDPLAYLWPIQINTGVLEIRLNLGLKK